MNQMLERIINDNTEFCRTATKQDGTSTMYGIKREDVEKYIKTESIYFVSGGILSEKKELYHRFKDCEVRTKNYFCIDVDIRNQYDGDLTNLDIVKEGLYFVEHLKEHHSLFGEWSYIVFSGNGLHIYYVGANQRFHPKQYKLGVQYIFKMWDDFIGEKALYSDAVCCNTARILRLPGTVNQKNGAKVKIIGEQNKNSQLMNNIKLYALIESYEEDIKNKINTEKFKMNAEKYTDGEGLYDQIQALPAYSIALMLIPEFPYDGKKNFKNQKKGFTAYFYSEANNGICNGGSRYFNWGDGNSCFGPFQIIKNWYSYTNAETFQWFKDNIFN